MPAILLNSAASFFMHPKEFAVLKGIAVDLARLKIENAGVGDLTDNSTGTAASSFADMVVPSAPFNAVSAGGATRTAWNTAVGKIEDAGKVLSNSFNNARVRIGRELFSAASGTQASADTIPAQDLTVATTSGVTSLDYAEGRAAMIVAKDNISKLANGLNEILRALGAAPYTNNLTGNMIGYALAAIPSAAASATGASAISKAAADAFLTAAADNLATIAQAWNNVMVQTGWTDLTDNSGGSASETIAALGTITPYTTAGTDLAPKAGFDTEIAKWRNNFSDLLLRINELRAYHGLSAVTDSGAGTGNTTLEAILVDLTAVDGTGNNGLAAASALTTWNAVKNNVATVVAAVNDLCPLFGLTELTDSSGGTADVSDPITVVAMADTGAGVDGTSLSGVADTEVDANLSDLRDAFASIAAKVNAMTGTSAPTQGLSVVAA